MKKISRRSFLKLSGSSRCFRRCSGSDRMWWLQQFCCCFHLYRSFFHRSFCCW